MSGVMPRLLLPAIALFITGCATSAGPQKLVPSHEGYNDAVQLTVTREVLKNVVRERYLEPPQFIRVASINASFSVSAGANVGVGGIGTSAAAGQTGANVGFSDSPTITFVPQSGAAEFGAFAAPIDLEAAIGFFYQWGTAQPYELELTVGAINDAPDRPGPVGDAYRAKVKALTDLISGGASIRYFRELLASQYAPIAKDQVDGEAFVNAAGEGVSFYETEDGMLRLGKSFLTLGLVVPLPHGPQIAANLEVLGLTPGKELYPIRPPFQAMPRQVGGGGLQSDTLWLSTRSTARIIELAAAGVDVPAEHLQSGIAPSEAALTTGVTVLLRIRHSASQPGSIYRIQHRGYWFYIDETDNQSKALFTALVTLYTSRFGATPRGSQPALVLPIGGS